MNKLSEMQCFVVTVESGNITDAARRLGIAKSVASQRIKNLESRLKCVLFERGRRLTLTPSGHIFYTHCVHILDEITKAEDSVQEHSTQLAGMLRLSAPVVFSNGYLADMLTHFALRYPALNMDIEYSDEKINLNEDKFDAAIRIGELTDSSLVARHICVNRHVICASPAYLSKYGTPGMPEELINHDAILYLQREANGMWALPVGEKTAFFRVRCRLRTNNGFQLLDAVKAGLGLGILPTFLAVPAILAGELKVVLQDYAPRGGSISLVYRESLRSSPRLKALADHLCEKISDPPVWDQKRLAATESGG